MFSYQELFEKPHHYNPTSISIHPALAAQITSIECTLSFPIYRYDTLMTEPSVDYGSGLKETGLNLGTGASFADPAVAFVKSVMEAFERKNSKVYEKQELRRATYDELGEQAVDPRYFSLISDWERRQSPLPYTQYTPELSLAWKQCYQVQSRSLIPVYIPATLVFSRYSWKNQNERFVPVLSPGLASHFTYREAFLRGLLELLERDAFMLAWLHRRSPPLIRAETVSFDDEQRALDYLCAFGFKVYFINITTDIHIPAVLTILENPRLPWEDTLVFGLGCHLDPHVALRHSFLESLAAMTNLVKFDFGNSKITLKKRNNVYGIKTSEYYKKTRFLMESPNQISIDDIPNHDLYDAGRNLEFLLEHLNARGFETFFVDLTPTDFQEDCRLCLTRAFIAGLQPMLYETDCWRLNPNRLFKKYNLDVSEAPVTSEFERLNLMPHPFMLME